MRYQLLSGLGVAAALALSVPAPALAQTAGHEADTRSAALKWEIGYLALSAIDAAQTVECLERGRCEEANPIFGEHPSSKKILLAKIGIGVAHFALFTHLNRRNPKVALRLAQVSLAVQGTAVGLNARFTFK